MNVKAGQCWDIRLPTTSGVACVTVLVLSTGPSARVRGLTLASTHAGMWPVGEVIAGWSLDDLRKRAERIA